VVLEERMYNYYSYGENYRVPIYINKAANAPKQKTHLLWCAIQLKKHKFICPLNLQDKYAYTQGLKSSVYNIHTAPSFSSMARELLDWSPLYGSVRTMSVRFGYKAGPAEGAEL